MDEGTLERVMIDFWERRYDVLVCTTIVESGIDLPSVNTLIVDRAERLGSANCTNSVAGSVEAASGLTRIFSTRPSRCSRRRPTSGCEPWVTTPPWAAVSRSPCAISRSRGREPLGHDQSGPVAAVGYDLYVQLVAEAVADAKGFRVPDVVRVDLDVPGEAHLPKEYVEADDARLEAYRRLAGVSGQAELDDLALEWVDRYGALPEPTKGLLDLAQLRLTCLAYAVTSVAVLPAQVGDGPSRSSRWGRSP